MVDTNQIKGKVALITGGADGIGLAYAIELLKNGQRFKSVSLIDINEKKGVQAVNELNEMFGEGKTIFLRADVSVQQELKDAFENTIKQFQQLDIVINNAGIIQERDWEKCLKVNLESAIRVTKLAVEHYIPKYREGNEGLLIITSSSSALAPISVFPVYTATKAALLGLARAYGTETFYRKFKVRVLTICPGGTDTSLLRHPPETYVPEIFMDEYKNHLVIPGQSAERVGQCLITAIREGTNGSVWGTDPDDPCYPVSNISVKSDST